MRSLICSKGDPLVGLCTKSPAFDETIPISPKRGVVLVFQTSSQAKGIYTLPKAQQTRELSNFVKVTLQTSQEQAIFEFW